MNRKSRAILFLLLAFLQVAAMAQTATLDEFLSTTRLNQRSEALEKLYHLDSGTLRDSKGYLKLADLEYGKLDFTVNVYVNDGECKAFGLWASQIRIKDRKGQLVHHDRAEIGDVFQSLLEELTKRFKKAPLVIFDSDSSKLGMDVPCRAYTWVNREYALMLVFYDNLTSHSVTLRQYRRNETEGEFTGENSLKYLKNLYAERSGKLPDDWPHTKTEIEMPEEKPKVNGISSEHSTSDSKRKEQAEANAQNRNEWQQITQIAAIVTITGLFVLVLIGILWFRRKSP